MVAQSEVRDRIARKALVQYGLQLLPAEIEVSADPIMTRNRRHCDLGISSLAQMLIGGVIRLRQPCRPGNSMLGACPGAYGHIYQKSGVFQVAQIAWQKVRPVSSIGGWFDMSGLYGVFSNADYIPALLGVGDV